MGPDGDGDGVAAGCAPRPRATAAIPTVHHTTLAGHESAVMAVRFTHTGAYALTAGRDRVVKLWNPKTGLCVKTYTGHGLEVNDAAASPDNARITTGGSDRSVFVWDVGSGQTIARFREHTAAVNCVRFNADATVVRNLCSPSRPPAPAPADVLAHSGVVHPCIVHAINLTVVDTYDTERCWWNVKGGVRLVRRHSKMLGHQITESRPDHVTR